MPQIKSILDLLKSIHFCSYFALYNFITLLKNKWLYSKVVNRTTFASLTDLKFSTQTTKTVFILGSGSSVNMYSERNWKLIKQNDSIGFNFWFFHDHIPSYYIFESPRLHENADKFIHNLNVVENRYSDVKFIMQAPTSPYAKYVIDKFPKSLSKNLFLSFDVPLPGNSNTDVSKSIKCAVKTGLIQKNNLNILFRKRSSICYIMLLAYTLGYEEIVLCGIDLNDPTYFYEDDNYQSNKSFNFPERNKNQVIHTTVDSSLNSITVDHVINEINNQILKPNGVKLYVGSKKSMLHPQIPFYKNFEV